MYVKGYTRITPRAYRLLMELGYSPEDSWVYKTELHNSFYLKDEDGELFHSIPGDPERVGLLLTQLEWVERGMK